MLLNLELIPSINTSIVSMLLLPMCIYWDKDIVVCLKEVLKDANVACVLIYKRCRGQ